MWILFSTFIAILVSIPSPPPNWKLAFLAHFWLPTLNHNDYCYKNPSIIPNCSIVGINIMVWLGCIRSSCCLDLRQIINLLPCVHIVHFSICPCPARSLQYLLISFLTRWISPLFALFLAMGIGVDEGGLNLYHFQWATSRRVGKCIWHGNFDTSSQPCVHH